jgi:hypothetical protein
MQNFVSRNFLSTLLRSLSYGFFGQKLKTITHFDAAPASAQASTLMWLLAALAPEHSLRQLALKMNAADFVNILYD